ncbi:MAG: hypothetical protein KA758_02580 [Acidimicrobiales bacterium]|jgi:hypothetical protein|nr:hypothetical protein [Acidimicrobiales bacterium]HMS87928.1 hypothetical protein [Acidimicrobiales bacterium]
MKKSTRGVRAAIAAGALGTALFTGIGPADAQSYCYESSINAQSIVPIYCTTETRPEDTTTTTEATTTTTEATTTTTEGERPTTTMGTVPTTMGPTTTAPVVDDATGARPVAARPSYTG